MNDTANATTTTLEMKITEELFPRYAPIHGTPDPMVRRLLTLWLPDGSLIEHKEQSGKIAVRKTDAFRADYLRSAEHVGTKWARFRPFYSTSNRWE